MQQLLKQLPEEGLLRTALSFYLTEPNHQNSVIVETLEAVIEFIERNQPTGGKN